MTNDIKISLPHNGWLPRHHQMPLWRYLRNGGKRAVAIWHRRAGKDEVALHSMAYEAAMRSGSYAYALPEYSMARKTVWSAVNPHTGIRRIDEIFPHELRESTNESEMFIRLIPMNGHSGSTFQLTGSDNYNTSLVGTSYAGIVFSEYALANPSAWAYARPVLEENDGWAVFISTPRGRNHCHDMYKHAAATPGWFSELLTAEQTQALTKQQLADALAEYKSLYGEAIGASQFQQEYMCSWDAGFAVGAIFAGEMAAVRAEGRVMEVKPPPGALVHRSWDLGMAHAMSVWWFCVSPSGQVLVLDHLAKSNHGGFEWWRDEIDRRHEEHGWRHGTDFVPHDAKVRELGSGGRTRVETMRRLGLQPRLVPDHTLGDGINAIRETLPLCVFHPRTEQGGLDALEQYRCEWDDERKCFKANAVVDWTADVTDSFRYLSMSWRTLPRREIPPPASEREGWHIPPPSEPKRGGIRL